MHRKLLILPCALLLAMLSHARAAEAPAAAAPAIAAAAPSRTAQVMSSLMVAGFRVGMSQSKTLQPAQLECMSKVSPEFLAPDLDPLLRAALSTEEWDATERFHASPLGSRYMAAIVRGDDPDRGLDAAELAQVKQFSDSMAFRKLFAVLPPDNTEATAVLEPVVKRVYLACLGPGGRVPAAVDGKR